MDAKEVVKETRPRMEASIDDFRRRLAAIRTGRANVNLLDSVIVDYYGTPTPLSQLASVHAPEPQMLTVTPWDGGVLGAVENVTDNGYWQSSNFGSLKLGAPRTFLLSSSFTF